jgi:hypothetical protein
LIGVAGKANTPDNLRGLLLRCRLKEDRPMFSRIVNLAALWLSFGLVSVCLLMLLLNQQSIKTELKVLRQEVATAQSLADSMSHKFDEVLAIEQLSEHRFSYPVEQMYRFLPNDEYSDRFPPDDEHEVERAASEN